MLSAFLLNKLYFIIIIALCSSYIKFSHQQQQPDFPFEQFNPFQLSAQNNGNFQSDINNQNWLVPGQELVFVTTTSRPKEKSVISNPSQELIFITTTSKPLENSVVYVNNQPVVPTMVPFLKSITTPTPEFLDCFRKCPTTSEFNPVCANNRQLYDNEQKFNCARQCGEDIKIVRRGSCEGLFPMSRG